MWDNINPGNSVQVKVVYDMPTDAVPASIKLHDSMLSNGVTVSLTGPDRSGISCATGYFADRPTPTTGHVFGGLIGSTSEGAWQVLHRRRRSAGSPAVSGPCSASMR